MTATSASATASGSATASPTPTSKSTSADSPTRYEPRDTTEIWWPATAAAGFATPIRMRERCTSPGCSSPLTRSICSTPHAASSPTAPGNAPPPDLTLTMAFHPQVVRLAGLLAGREWERRAVGCGHVAWLIEQITVRNILLGYVPKERTDPLIQWVERHFSTHKFVAFHRSPMIYDAFFPRETIPPPRQPDEADAETRWSPFHPYYRC